jgi:hypothetical protein
VEEAEDLDLHEDLDAVGHCLLLQGPDEFEAGAVANWLGATFSVVSGGVGCLIATAWVTAATPALRRYRASMSGARTPV